MEIAEDKMVGAIFMCNRTTLKECFRSKVFGLPSRYTEFVGKVKAGMILFLFEYEERKLYGVYEAATDGAINISPSAFSKTTKFFPAQVMYEIIWKCYPLTEDEFRDAIRDNYFAPYKFHFGLSHEQVATLLDLFSLRKSKPKNQPSTKYHESYRLENGNNMARRPASIDDTDSRPSLDYKGSMYNQHFEPVHKIQNTDMDLRNYLTRDRARNSNVSHTSLDTNPKDMLGGKHTMYTHDPDLVFKNQDDLDNEYIPYHISHSECHPHNLTGSTSQLEYYPEEPLHLSPITQQIYPNYGIESTSITVNAEHVEPKCNYRYSDLDNYRYSSTDYLKESNLNKIGADASNLAPKFTRAAYSPPQNFGTMPLKTQDNSDNFPSLSMERCLNFDYDSLSLKYCANVMDHTSSLNSNSANRYGYWKMHPESSNCAYIGKSEFSASMEAADDLSKLSLEPNSTTKDHDVVKRYYTELQSSEPGNMKEYDAIFGHYRNIYPSKFSNANEYGREHLEFQSETPKRKSVFSRISKNVKLNDISGMEDKSPSQLLNILAQRKKKWNTIINSPKSSHHDSALKRSKTWHRVKSVDADFLLNESKESTKGSLNLSSKKNKHTSLIESKDGDTTGHVKNDDNFELTCDVTKKSGVLDGFNEATMRVPIKNFKRRSVTQEKTSESAVKGKRPRLIRPSFTDNDTEGVANEGHLALESSKISVSLLPVKENLVAENCEVALEANKMSIGASSGKVNAVAENFQIDNKITDFNLDRNSNVSIKVESTEEENVLAMTIHTHSQMPNNTVEMAESSGFAVENKKTDVSSGRKSKLEERHILASQTHYDEANDTDEMVQNYGFQAESKKSESNFDQNSNGSIKAEPVEEGHILISHSRINKPNYTNVMAESSGFQAKSRKIEVNIAQKSYVSIKVEPVEEERIFSAHIQNGTLNGTIEKDETLGKDREQVSYSSVASKAIVHGNEVAPSRSCINLKYVNKNIGGYEGNVKENVPLYDTNAVIFQADFGAEPMSTSEENTEANFFKSPNLCIKTDTVEERLVNSSHAILVKSENPSNLCVKTDRVEGCFEAENGAEFMKSSAENTGINYGNKLTSLCTNSVENEIPTSEKEKKSSALIDLNEVAATNDVIGGKSHIEPDATAVFN